MIANTLSRKQENLATAREKIQASRKNRIINPAAIAKILAATYPDEMAITYPDKMVIIYLDETLKLSELKNPRRVRFSRLKISERLGGIIREAVNRLIRLKTKEESRVRIMGG